MKLTKFILLLYVIYSPTICSYGQQTSVSKIILIGDAGKKNRAQQEVIAVAAAQVIAGKTMVIFLGDNIYPRGMNASGTNGYTTAKEILHTQFEAFAKKNVPVYFIPGNHDYDKSSKLGWQKMNDAHNYFDSLQSSSIYLVPERNCGDPTIIYNDTSICVVALDTEWLLYSYKVSADIEHCQCSTNDEVYSKLSAIALQHKQKQLLVVGHHPLISYGSHGGYYSIKDHIFPLTNYNKKWYLPLPVVGSLYPFLRNTFVNPEDIKHVNYQAMKNAIEPILKTHGNAVYVAGHEHNMQFINNGYTAIVSGAGAKSSYVKKGTYANYTNKNTGFATIDMLDSKQLNLQIWSASNNFKQVAYTQTNPFKEIKSPITITNNIQDSILFSANKNVANKSNMHLRLFGKNYRNAWSTPATLPYIQISKIYGGLTPTERGGGQQSKSIRLIDKRNEAWVIRTVNKYPDIILPEELRKGLAKDILYDAMSAQHPYSALVVPTLCEALKIPHVTPIIGVIAPDTALGIYANDFVNTICLLEKREAIPNSINSLKLFSNLQKDNDNTVDKTTFLKARFLDLIIGDWDRHKDQWRWGSINTTQGKKYIPIPRDRDQVFHVMNGVIPKIATINSIAPKLHHFSGNYKKLFQFFTNGADLNAQLLSGISKQQWMNTATEVVNTLQDDVLITALKKLPKEIYAIEATAFLNILKQRRANLIHAAALYYNFLHKHVEIVLTDKNEFVEVTTQGNKQLEVLVRKLNKKGIVEDTLYLNIFDSKVTKSINIYTYKGQDSIIINNTTNIKIRLIQHGGDKKVIVSASKRKIDVFDKKKHPENYNNTKKLAFHISRDSAMGVYTFNNPYNTIAPLLALGYNIDDGILLGGSLQYIRQGFKKTPFASKHQINLLHAVATDAFRFGYNGHWETHHKKIDWLANINIAAPNNTQNFFGAGNNTVINKDIKNKLQYYRSRFSLFEAGVHIRNQITQQAALQVGVQFQGYRLRLKDTIGRFIANKSELNTYDSISLDQHKMHIGLATSFTISSINKKVLPTRGATLVVQTVYNYGLNKASKNFMQLSGSFSFYKSLDMFNKLVLANRTGGGFTLGKAAFYQQQFLGGHENLLGYRRFRFAGSNVLYNNTELRIRIKKLSSYVFIGDFGLLGFFDIGRVWINSNASSKWHNGAGGGFYFVPGSLVTIQALAGVSKEGILPYVTFGMRF